MMKKKNEQANSKKKYKCEIVYLLDANTFSYECSQVE
jgi:hypothetical protein